MVIGYAKYEVKFNYGEAEMSIIVLDEEGMNEDEIVTEAQVTMQREDIGFDTEKFELISCTLIK